MFLFKKCKVYIIGGVASAQAARQQKSRRYTMTLTRWRLTTLYLGAGAAGLSRRIVKCGGGNVIGGRSVYESSCSIKWWN